MHSGQKNLSPNQRTFIGEQYTRWTNLWQESQYPHFVNTSETAFRTSFGVNFLQTQHFSLSGTDSSLLEQSSLTFVAFRLLEIPEVPWVGLHGLDFLFSTDLTDLTFCDLDIVAWGFFFLLTGFAFDDAM